VRKVLLATTPRKRPRGRCGITLHDYISDVAWLRLSNSMESAELIPDIAENREVF